MTTTKNLLLVLEKHHVTPTYDLMNDLLELVFEERKEAMQTMEAAMLSAVLPHVPNEPMVKS